MALCKKLAAKTIQTTVKMHGQLVTWSSCYRVNSSQCYYTQRSTPHDFRVWWKRDSLFFHNITT